MHCAREWHIDYNIMDDDAPPDDVSAHSSHLDSLQQLSLIERSLASADLSLEQRAVLSRGRNSLDESTTTLIVQVRHASGLHATFHKRADEDVVYM